MHGTSCRNKCYMPAMVVSLRLVWAERRWCCFPTLHKTVFSFQHPRSDKKQTATPQNLQHYTSSVSSSSLALNGGTVDAIFSSYLCPYFVLAVNMSPILFVLFSRRSCGTLRNWYQNPRKGNVWVKARWDIEAHLCVKLDYGFWHKPQIPGPDQTWHEHKVQLCIHAREDFAQRIVLFPRGFGS